MTLDRVPAPEAFLGATFVVALVAAVFDWRTKRIPNALTVGALVLALPLHAWISPAPTGYESWAIGALACVFPAAIGWRLGWVGGGDVKLIAAMGALGGIQFGLEAVFLSLFSALAFILLKLCWNGVLLRTVVNGVGVAASHTVWRSRTEKVAPSAELSGELRFGPFALAGASMSLYLHGAVL